MDDVKVQLAFSWEIAAQLVAWFPDHRVYELHPGGGTYDCLSLRGPRAKVDVNRTGSTHVQNVRPHGAVVPMEEMRAAAGRPGGADVVVGKVLDCYGIMSSGRRPATTPQALTYRVVAAVLTSRLVGDADWDCRSLFHDSSGDGGSSEPDMAPVADFADVPMNEVWVLTRDDVAVAHLWDGWAVTASGERRDLMARYDRGATVDAPRRRPDRQARHPVRPRTAGPDGSAAGEPTIPVRHVSCHVSPGRVTRPVRTWGHLR